MNKNVNKDSPMFIVCNMFFKVCTKVQCENNKQKLSMLWNCGDGSKSYYTKD